MDAIQKVKNYSQSEERVNVISHGFGFVLGALALVFMLIKTVEQGVLWEIVGALVFGVSLMVLYAASTLYHSSENDKRRSKLKVFDHAAIYVLIAGTYTPYTLVTLHGTIGWILFATSWGIALIGIVLKLFFTGRFNIVSTVMYVAMGWIIVFAYKPLVCSLSISGINWLFAGGIAYTVGAILYSIKKIPMNHAIFHVFVLLGSICHFISIYLFVM